MITMKQTKLILWEKTPLQTFNWHRCVLNEKVLIGFDDKIKLLLCLVRVIWCDATVTAPMDTQGTGWNEKRSATCSTLFLLFF